MTNNEEKHPSCYGKLDVVFPLAENGLRFTPNTCLKCTFKTACLRSAMNGSDGLVIKEEMLDRAYQSGMIGFWERWSEKKVLHRKKVRT